MLPAASNGGPFSTGLPDDLAPTELAEWLDGRLELDDESRATWWQEQEARGGSLSIYLEDHLVAAVDELRDLGELALQEADFRPVQQLHARNQSGGVAVHETDRALDVIGMWLAEPRGPRTD